MKKNIAFIGISIMIAAWTSSAWGLTMNFKGIVTSTDKNAVAIAEISPGDSVSGQYDFNPNAPDEIPLEPASGLYEAQSFQITVRGFDYVSSTDNNISVTNDAVLIAGQPAMDAYEVVSSLRNVEGPALSGLPPAQIDVVLVDTDAAAFSDDSLPTSIDLDGFEIVSEEPFGTTGGRLIFQSLTTGGIGEVRFAITEWTVGEETAVYYPHVAADDFWETEIGVINTSSTTGLTGTLTPYDSSGTIVSAPVAVELNPNGRSEYQVGQSFSNASQIRYIVLTTESADVRGYLKFFQTGQFRVAIPAVLEINEDDIFIPHIASNDAWATGINLVNTSDSTKNLEIEFSDGQVYALNLPGRAHRALAVRSMLGGPRPGVESAVIRGADGIVGLEVFLNAEANIISGVLIKDDTATWLDYPHVVGDATWDTALVAQNPGESATDMNILSYSADGELLGQQNIEVAAGGKYIGNVRPGPISLDLPAGTAWIGVNANQGLTGFELFVAENRMGGYTGVGIRKTQGVFAKLDKDGWTGIALVNPVDSPATVTLQAFDDAGNLNGEAELVLEAFSKIVDAPERLFSSDISDATHIQFVSTTQIAAFQLNNSGDNMMLDALPAL